MNEPLVSIFMPVYNGQEFLDDTIINVLSQSYKNFELVCVDDSSTDSSVDIIKKYSAKDNRVVLYEKEKGGNVPKSFNYILPKLRGDFYLYMSQDDKLSTDLLEEEVNVYNKTGGDVIVPICKFSGSENEQFIIKLNEGEVISGNDAFLLCLKWKMHGFNLVKMSLIKDEVCDESIYNSDEFLTFRYLFKANRVASCNGIFYYYRNNPNSITKSPKAYRVQRIENNFAIYYFIKDHIGELPSWVDGYWYNIIIQNLYWAYLYNKNNKHMWSEDERIQVHDIIVKNWNAIEKGIAPYCLLRYPKTYLKYIYLRSMMIRF